LSYPVQDKKSPNWCGLCAILALAGAVAAHGSGKVVESMEVFPAAQGLLA
jgi:hypothetical protein